MVQKIKGNIVTDIDLTEDSQKNKKQYKQKVRYSNGGIVVKKSEAFKNMKVISMIHDVTPDKSN